MKIDGAHAIVTGAAGGIGEAVAQRLLASGASVVLTDLDGERLATTADTLAGQYGARVAHVAGDVADAGFIQELISVADGAFGPVDMYVANAGVFRGFGLEAGEAEWSLSWDVNVMAHVRAAQALIPGWLERGAGCFVSTASAAGLLTQLGSPTYSVTKHAALGFAEWLAATYGDRGIQVCCLCPMGVRTAILGDGSNSGDSNADLGLHAVTGAGEVLEAGFVADVLLEAIEAETFLALPHRDVAKMFAGKAADHDRWITGMQRYRRSLES